MIVGTAIAVWHQPRSEAWAMSPREYDMALEAHNRFHGGGEPEVDTDHLRDFIADTKAQYPDNPA